MKTLIEIAAALQTPGTGTALLLLVAKATVILLIGRLVIAATPRASGAAKHVIATVTLGAALFLVFVAPFVPSWELALLDPPRATRAIGALGDEEPSSIGTAISVVRASGVVPAQPLSFVETSLQAARLWRGLLILGIAVVSLLMLLHMLVGMVGVGIVARRAEAIDDSRALAELESARRNLGLARTVRLLRSEDISVPVIWGFFRPVLMLPAESVDWSMARMRVVLMHELAHLKRFDGATLLFSRAAVAILWFHPLAWSLHRCGRNACERACDDLVLASGAKPSEYADHLLGIAKALPTFDPFRSVTLAMSRKSQLEGRLLSILQTGVSRAGFTLRGVMIACAVAAFVVIPVAAVRFTADTEPMNPPRMMAKKLEPKQSGTELTVMPQLAELFADEPRNGEDWFNRGSRYYSKSRYQESVDAYAKAIALNYRPATSNYNAACSYALMDDRENALRSLSAAMAAGWDDLDHIARDSDLDPIRSDPRFARIVNDSSGRATNMRVEDTLDHFRDLQTAHETDGDEWYDAGINLLRLRRFDESVAAFEKAIQLDGKPASAAYNIACAYALRGDKPRAMAALQKAIDLGFNDMERFDNDPDIASLRNTAEFVKLHQMATDLRLHNGRSWFFFDDWDSALDHHRAMVRDYPKQGRAWFNLGYAALQARKMPESIQAFQQANALGFRVGTSSYNIACAYALSGNREAAFQWLAKAKQAGFAVEEHLENDEDLDSLRRDPRYKALAKS